MSSVPQLDAVGRPLRDLRISVTDRCNFRCSYCMPGDVYGEKYRFLPRTEILSFEEIERLARLFASLGATKLRVTGGEPLIRHELPALIERLAAIEEVEDLALTTNGYLLADFAGLLKDAGLQRVTVSLDSDDEEVFKHMTGRNFSPDRVLAGIDAAARVGLTPIKINCVVRRGVNDHTLVALARRFRGTGHIVRFIEFMDVGTRNAWDLEQVVPAGEIVDWLEAVAGRTRREPLESELADGFEAPLARALSFPDMPAPVREAARDGLAALEGGTWRPAWVLAHNDLWKGNVLRAGSEKTPCGSVGSRGRSRDQHTDAVHRGQHPFLEGNRHPVVGNRGSG